MTICGDDAAAAATAPVATDHVAIRASPSVQPRSHGEAGHDGDLDPAGRGPAHDHRQRRLVRLVAADLERPSPTPSAPGTYQYHCAIHPFMLAPWWSPMAERDDAMNHLDAAGRALIDREVDRRGFLKCASWVRRHHLDGGERGWCACGTTLTGQGAGSASDAPPVSTSSRSATATSASRAPRTPMSWAASPRRSPRSTRCRSAPAFVVHAVTSPTPRRPSSSNCKGVARDPQDPLR